MQGAELTLRLTDLLPREKRRERRSPSIAAALISLPLAFLLGFSHMTHMTSKRTAALINNNNCINNNNNNNNIIYLTFVAHAHISRTHVFQCNTSYTHEIAAKAATQAPLPTELY